MQSLHIDSFIHNLDKNYYYFVPVRSFTREQIAQLSLDDSMDQDHHYNDVDMASDKDASPSPAKKHKALKEKVENEPAKKEKKSKLKVFAFSFRHIIRPLKKIVVSLRLLF